MPPLKRQLLTVVFAVALVTVLALLYFAKIVVIVCLIGIGIGVLASPPLDYFQRRFHIPRALSALLLFAAVCAALAGVGYGVFLLVADQAEALSQQAPDIVRKVQALATRNLPKVPWLADEISKFDFASPARSLGSFLLGGVASGVTAISGLVFAAVLGLYTAIGSQGYYDSMLNAFAPRSRPTAAGFLLACAQVLRKWFRAQLLDMLIVGALTAIGLWIVGMPYWAVFGLLAAVFGIIPYVGVFLVVILAIIVTLAVDPGNLPWVALVFFATQQIEGHIVLPLVMKGGADLPQVPLLVFMLLLGSWLGLLGVFLAPPLFAICGVAYRRFYLPWVGGT